MASRCETCGNEYERTFEVVMNGVSHSFDSFECAIERLAPRCARCGVRVVGHGVENARAVHAPSKRGKPGKRGSVTPAKGRVAIIP
jgi:hypothetical protein